MCLCVWGVPLQRWTGHCDAGEHLRIADVNDLTNDDEYDNANLLPVVRQGNQHRGQFSVKFASGR